MDETGLTEEHRFWQSIDTAPVNKMVLVFVPIPHHRLVLATQTDYGLWLKEDHQPMSYKPSHWMSLPHPPSNFIGE